MGNGFYSISFKKISLVLEKSFPHKHSDADLGKNQSVQIDIEEINDIFYKESYAENTKKSGQIRPHDIFVTDDEKYIQDQQENERSQSHFDENARIMSNNIRNLFYVCMFFHDLFSQHVFR